MIHTQNPTSNSVGSTPPKIVTQGDCPVSVGFAVTTTPLASNWLNRWSSANAGRFVLNSVARVPRYEAIAEPHGYTVLSTEVAQVRDERDLFQLIEQAIARKG